MQPDNNALLNHIYKNLALPGLISSFLVFIVIVFAIVTGQSLLTPALLGIVVGGVAGPLIIIFLKKRNKGNLSKRKTEVNNIFDSYASQRVTLFALLAYLIIISCLIYFYNKGDVFSIDNFIFYFIFSCITTLNLYSGLGYYTAWTNYKRATSK